VASRSLVSHAFHGRRPSASVKLEDVGMSELAATNGRPVEGARAVVVALHGRSSTAETMLARVREITGDDASIAVVAPQAFDNEWYHGRNFESRAALGARLEESVAHVQKVLDDVVRRSSPERVVLCGFSQGACLALEVFTRRSERLGAVWAFSGAVIGTPDEDRPPGDAAEGTPVLLGASEGDPWVKRSDIERSAALVAAAGADVTIRFVPGDAHALHDLHRDEARASLGALRALASN
jgi:phospholipase/carboxylesterase